MLLTPSTGHLETRINAEQRKRTQINAYERKEAGGNATCKRNKTQTKKPTQNKKNKNTKTTNDVIQRFTTSKILKFTQKSKASGGPSGILTRGFALRNVAVSVTAFRYRNEKSWNHFTEKQLIDLSSGYFEFKEIGRNLRLKTTNISASSIQHLCVRQYEVWRLVSSINFAWHRSQS